MPTQRPNEIKRVIDKVLGGFNNKDSALYNSAFGADAVVIDGVAPYRWTGSNAAQIACPCQDSEQRLGGAEAENIKGGSNAI